MALRLEFEAEATGFSTADLVPSVAHVVKGLPVTLFLDSFLEPGQESSAGGAGHSLSISDVPARLPEYSVTVSTSADFEVVEYLPGKRWLTVLLLGDSHTYFHHYPNQVQDRLESFGVEYLTFLGESNPSYAPGVYAEGRGGWTAAKYIADATSPFVFSGALDVAQYLENEGTPDVVVIHLGTNDAFLLDADDPDFASDVSALVDDLQALVDDFLAANAALRVAVAPPMAVNPYTAAYDSVATTAEQWRKAHRGYVQEVVDRFAGYTRADVLWTHACLNRSTDYSAGNAAHPRDYGYRKLGDCVAAYCLGRAY